MAIVLRLGARELVEIVGVLGGVDGLHEGGIAQTSRGREVENKILI